MLAGGGGEGIDIALMREAVVFLPSLDTVQIRARLRVPAFCLSSPGEIYPHPDGYQRQQLQSSVFVFLIIIMTHGYGPSKKAGVTCQVAFVNKQEGQADCGLAVNKQAE